jgi:hypothetical protein
VVGPHCDLIGVGDELRPDTGLNAQASLNCLPARGDDLVAHRGMAMHHS